MYKKKHDYFVIFILFFAATGGMLYGYDLGVISGVFLFIRHDILMSTDDLSLIAGAVLGGGAFSTLVSGWLAEYFGRRKMIKIASILFIISILSIYYAHSFLVVLFSRIFQGVAIGIITIIIPLYITEVAPKNIRGRSVSLFQLFLTLGILLSSLVGLFFTETQDWRAMFLTALVPAFILLIGSFVLVKSPRWLIQQGRYNYAIDVLDQIHRGANKAEFLALKESFMKERNGKQNDNSPFFLRVWRKKSVLYPLGLVILIGILNQLTGINSIIQFSSVILKDTGMQSNIVAMLGSSLITLVNFIVTLIVLFFIDKLERKVLPLIGIGGVIVALVFLSMVSGWMDDSMLKGILMMSGLIGYILFFALGPGTVVWTLISELLPQSIRSIGLSIALFFNSVASSLLASFFVPLSDKIGFSGVFLFCSVCCTFYFYICLCKLPHTSGRSLEEIEREFERKGGPV